MHLTSNGVTLIKIETPAALWQTAVENQYHSLKVFISEARTCLPVFASLSSLLRKPPEGRKVRGFFLNKSKSTLRTQ